MKNEYKDIYDIAERLGLQPQWFDERGVPRFSDFSPLAATIHGDELVLAEVRCQRCGKSFKVSKGKSYFAKSSLQNDIILGTVAYGDPPFHPNCIGTTMLALDIQVLEYWYNSKQTHYMWVRDSRFEVYLIDEPLKKPSFFELSSEG